MLNFTPLDPPEPSFASLCRQFGRALRLFIKDALRVAITVGCLWFVEQLLGFHL